MDVIGISRKKCNKTRFLRSSTALIVMLFTLVQVFPVFAASSGEVTGTFAAKAPPTLESVVVKTATATAIVDGDDIDDTDAADMNFSGAGVLSFTLNGTTIVLNGGATTYSDIGDIAESIQSQLDAASNTTVTATDSGADGHIILTGAAGQNIVISAGSGTLSKIGLTAGTTAAVTSTASTLSPNSTYNVEVTVTEPDGIGSASGGLDTVVTKIWYDSNGSNNLQAYFDLQTTPSTTKCAIITWDRETNSATLSSGADSSWSLGTCTLPSTEILADSSQTTFTFIFPVQIGKIANITSDPARWQFGSKATDNDATFHYAYLATGLPMSWYGEITLPEGTKAEWGRVEPGLDYADPEAKVNITGMTLLSNGEYYERIKASKTWSDDAGTTTVTRSLDAAETDEFQIVADTASTYAAATVKSIPVVDGTSIAINSNAYTANTSYTGTAVNNYLYLKLNDTFPTGKTFTGTITYLISNQS